jgi:predicted GNAT family N-acyltransferase
MAIKIIDHNSEEYKKMVQLRFQVLREPLGLNFSHTELDREREDILIAAFDDDELLGCCILTDQAGEPATLKLRQMAVKGNLQGKGVGNQMLHFAENIAKDLGNQKVMMHARENAIGFYQKQGYKIVSDVFEEVSIPHYKMEKQLI